jgi:hypothetical protein
MRTWYRTVSFDVSTNIDFSHSIFLSPNFERKESTYRNRHSASLQPLLCDPTKACFLRGDIRERTPIAYMSNAPITFECCNLWLETLSRYRRYRISDMNPSKNLSPHIAAIIATATTSMTPTGKGTPPHKTRPPAKTAPNMNLRSIVTMTSHAGRWP